MFRQSDVGLPICSIPKGGREPTEQKQELTPKTSIQFLIAIFCDHLSLLRSIPSMLFLCNSICQSTAVKITPTITMCLCLYCIAMLHSPPPNNESIQRKNSWLWPSTTGTNYCLSCQQSTHSPLATCSTPPTWKPHF